MIHFSFFVYSALGVSIPSAISESLPTAYLWLYVGYVTENKTKQNAIN
jgi:hypothetical protein